MGKKCDLCRGVARMYCESDEASLCWDCDGKVHGANFLVAKHTRCLLCTVCQSLTPWNATGLRLFPTFSVCDSCFVSKNGGGGNRILSENRDHEEVNSFSAEEDGIREESDEEYSNDEEEVDVDDDEEAENQVVPLSEPPPVMSSSSSDGGLVMKRTRDNSDLLCSDDEIGSSSVQESNYSPPLKRSSRGEPSFRSTAVVNSMVRLSEERTLNGPDTSSSSSLDFAISETRRDLSR